MYKQILLHLKESYILYSVTYSSTIHSTASKAMSEFCKFLKFATAQLSFDFILACCGLIIILI